MEDKVNQISIVKKDLTGKMVRGSVWILGVKIGGSCISLVSTLILARLLSPSDFGILGIALLVIALLETFSETGFDLALVQKKGDISNYLDVAWVVSIARGVLIGLLVFLSAPFVAKFFNSPESADVLRILSLSPFLRGLDNIGIVFFRKDMQFNKIFILNLSDIFARAVISVILAVILKNVFALAYGILASRIVNLVLSYVLHPYRPRLNFNMKKARELFDFGKWLLGSSIIKYVINQGDKAVVGKLIDATSLGFYGLAYRMSMLPVTQVTNVVSQVMFPTFSILQADPDQLRKRFLETIQVLSFFSVPLAGLIFIFSYDFVRLFLGTKWLPAVPIIHIFSILGFITSISASTGPFFNGIGKPKIITNILLARFLILALLIYPLTRIWGVEGAALTVLISAIVLDPFAIYLVSKLSQNRLAVVCRSILIPLFNTLIMVLFVHILKPFLIDVYGIPAFFSLVLMSIALYLSMAYLLDKILDDGALVRFRKIIRHLAIRQST